MLFTALCLTSAVTTLIVVLAVLVVFLAVFFALVPVGTWFRALVSGARISMGRLREDTVYDYKFVGLSHNTVRGAAGGAILCAELLKAQGYIEKK